MSASYTSRVAIDYLRRFNFSFNPCGPSRSDEMDIDINGFVLNANFAATVAHTAVDLGSVSVVYDLKEYD